MQIYAPRHFFRSQKDKAPSIDALIDSYTIIIRYIIDVNWVVARLYYYILYLQNLPICYFYWMLSFCTFNVCILFFTFLQIILSPIFQTFDMFHPSFIFLILILCTTQLQHAVNYTCFRQTHWIEYLRSRCDDFDEHVSLINADLSINWLTHRDRTESRSPLTITMTPVCQTGERVAWYSEGI